MNSVSKLDIEYWYFVWDLEIGVNWSKFDSKKVKFNTKNMTINYWAVLVCGVASMILGMLWYGFIFGKAWMKVIGVDPKDKKHMEEMGKGTGVLYLISFILALLQAYVLAHFIAAWQGESPIVTALWLWGGFAVPLLAGASMWNNEPASKAWSRFFIQTGYQLVLFVSFGLILGYWT